MYVVQPIEQEREKISQIIKDLSEYYDCPVSDKKLEMYTDDLVELGPELTLKAALTYRRKWGNRTFPFPAQLREAIHFITRDLYVL